VFNELFGLLNSVIKRFCYISFARYSRKRVRRFRRVHSAISSVQIGSKRELDISKIRPAAKLKIAKQANSSLARLMFACLAAFAAERTQ
jgi:hypothetical protein